MYMTLLKWKFCESFHFTGIFESKTNGPLSIIRPPNLEHELSAYTDSVICGYQNYRLLQLKNPWSHIRWRGNFSELDLANWTNDLKEALDYDPRSASSFDNGIFWIDYDSILRFFDVFYMNWNPELFTHTFCMHQYGVF